MVILISISLFMVTVLFGFSWYTVELNRRQVLLSNWLINRGEDLSWLNELTEQSFNAFDTLSTRERDSFCIGAFYKGVREEWHSTVFIKQRIFIGAHATDTLNPEAIFVYKDKNGTIQSYYRVYVAVVCRSFIMTDSGAVLHLVDPYGHVNTCPLPGLNEETASACFDRLLFVEGEYDPANGVINNVKFNLTNLDYSGDCVKGELPVLQSRYDYSSEKEKYCLYKL